MIILHTLGLAIRLFIFLLIGVGVVALVCNAFRGDRESQETLLIWIALGLLIELSDYLLTP